MAIAIRPEFVDPPEQAELARLVESIETLVADYLRRSIVRRESDVPLSTVIRDLRALLDSASN
jgi:hypothetical protein